MIFCSIVYPFPLNSGTILDRVPGEPYDCIEDNCAPHAGQNGDPLPIA